MNRRYALFQAAGIVAALGLGVAAHGTRARLKDGLRTAVAHAMGLEINAVEIDRVALGWDGLTVDGLSAGQLAIRHAHFTPTLGSLVSGKLAGTLTADSIVLEDPPLGAFDRLLVDRAQVTINDSIRVHAHGVTAELGAWAHGLPVVVGELGVEVERHGYAMRRAAFTSLSVGPLRDLAGGLHRRDGVVSLSAAATGVHLAAQLLDDGLDTSLTFDGFRLGFDETSLPWPQRLGMPSGELALTGTTSLHATRGGAARVQLALDTRGQVRAPRMAAGPIELDGLAVTATGTLDEDRVKTTWDLGRKDAHLNVDVSLETNDDDEATLAVTATLPDVACSTLLAALPSALRPALDGMGVDGDVKGQLTTRIPLAAPDQLSLDGDLQNHCKVGSEPPLADATRLKRGAPRLPGARDARGQPLAFELGRSNKSFRALEQIPKRVVDTFLEAEDGHFYRHHGVELLQIRRALSHDLETGAPGRGGSTITQQVAKNMFLSGEKTIGRKLEEAVLAWRLEQDLDKDRILELYLNLVELGPGIYGLAEGSRAYFDKDVSALTTEEATKLAALLPAPKRGMDEAWSQRYAQLAARLARMAQLKP